VQAVVLAGGLGTRLQPLTLDTPKPLVLLHGRPILAHVLARLAEAGVERVALATGHRGADFAALAPPAGVELLVATEAEPLGTGGAIANAAARLDPSGPLLVLNGDLLSDHDLRAQLALHERRDAAATLHVRRVDDARAFGLVRTGEQESITGFAEKPASPVPLPGLINAGTYVLSAALVAGIARGRACSFERELLPAWLGSARVVAHVEQSYGRDLGTPAGYLQASADLVAGVVTSPALPRPLPGGEAVIEPDAHVHPQASVLGGSYVGTGALVEARAVVRASVLMPGAHVGAGAHADRSVLGANSRLEPGVSLVEVVLGERALIGAGNQLAGCRVWPGVHLAATSIRLEPLLP